MINLLNNNYILKVAGILLFTGIACTSKTSRLNSENVIISDIKSAYDKLETHEENEYAYQQFCNHENKNARIFNDLISKHKNNWDDRKLLSLIDSINKLAETEKIPELMLQYANFAGAKIALKYNRPKQAYLYNLRSLKSIQEFPNSYQEERERNEKLKELISNTFFNSFEIKYGDLKKKMESNSFDDDILLRNYYNLALFAYELEKYDESRHYINSYLKHQKNPEDNKLYSDAMALSALNFAKLGKVDSIAALDEKLLTNLRNHQISEREYNGYLAHSLLAHFDALNQNQLEQRIQYLYSYFNYPEKNNYFRSVISEAESKYYEYKKNRSKEKKVLIQASEQIVEGEEIDDYRMNEQGRIYERLVQISIDENNQENTRYWFSKLKEFEKLKISLRKEYITFLQYLSQRDLELSKYNYSNLKENVHSQEKINILYFSIVIVFVILVIYSTFLFFKSEKYKVRIKEKYEQISRENTTIKEQNKELKIAIDSLQESNQDLNNFAKVAAHDIKSPISTINSGISYLKEIYNDKILPEHHKFFDELENSVTELVGMINTLLDQNRKTE